VELKLSEEALDARAVSDAQNAANLRFDSEREVELKGLSGRHRIHSVSWSLA